MEQTFPRKMSYYSLNIEPPVFIGADTIIETLFKINDEAEKALHASGGALEPVAWYDHERDLRQLSNNFPELLFVLSGEGENPDDLWIKYFKAGRMQESYVEITFEPFDEAKLK